MLAPPQAVVGSPVEVAVEITTAKGDVVRPPPPPAATCHAVILTAPLCIQ